MKKTGFYLIPEIVKAMLGRVAYILIMLILFVLDAILCPIWLIVRIIHILCERLAAAVAKAGLILDDLEDKIMDKI